MRAVLLLALLVVVPVQGATGDDFTPLGWEPERRNLRFVQFDSRDGLAQSIVNTIAQDAEGFMWFGTQEGLTRYDGNRAVSYLADSDDPRALPQDWIWTLLASRRGTLWIGTNGGGLVRYRPKTDDFVTVAPNPDSATGLSGGRIRALHEDSSGVLWVGTLNSGLNRFDPQTGDFTQFHHDPNDPSSLPDEQVISIVEDRNGRLWVGTADHGIARYDRESDSFLRFTHDPDNPESLSDPRIRSLTVDGNGRLWVATEAGLNLYDPTMDSFQRFLADENRSDSLPANLVRDVLQDHLGTVWVATDKGLAEWIGNDRFITYVHDPEDRDSLSTDPLTDLHVDRSGNLWVASYAGVNKWNYVSDLFSYYDKNTGHLRENLVTAVEEGPDGSLWVGTYGGGLAQIDRGNQRVRHFVTEAGTNGISDDRVMTLAVATDGTLYLGTRGAGFSHLDPRTGQWTHYSMESTRGTAGDGLASNGITSLQLEPDGTLWVGTYGGGVSRLRNGRFTTFRHDANDSTTLSSDVITSILRDRAGNLWFGTEDAGLNRLRAGTTRFERFQHDPANLTGLPSNGAWLTFEDKLGNLWIGTMDAGVARWSAENRQAGRYSIESLSSSDLGSSSSVLAIEQDRDGDLWIASNKGLTRFDPVTRLAQRYDDRNGLRGNEFMMGVSVSGDDGTLYFGSDRGLLSFTASDTTTSRPVPQVAASARSRNQLLARAFSSDISPPMVELTYPYYALSFDFSALDFVSPDKNRFAYQLTGFDTEWLDPGDYPRATYTNLPAGHYSFRVRAANSSGEWNEEGVTISVEVIPPPWRSSWALASYVIAPLLLVAMYLRGQRRKLEQSQAMQLELKAQVDSRTLELQQQNEQLADLNEQLRKASITDTLTGLRNRRFFYEVIKPQVASLDRHYSSGTDVDKRGVFFMMIDLDGFKQLNDRFGHHAGDRALEQLATLLSGTCRESDVVCRWGGDEFLILGEVADGSETEILADRIRERIEAFEFETGTEHAGHMTASIGICSYPLVAGQPGVASWETTSQLADQAAYIAKSSGKNRWVRLEGTRRLSSLSTSEARHRAHELVVNRKLTLVSSAPVQVGSSDD
ncbi:MAG: two-component regulator propeller domain-containing protein [Pseudomonadota bacterium]